MFWNVTRCIEMFSDAAALCTPAAAALLGAATNMAATALLLLAPVAAMDMAEMDSVVASTMVPPAKYTPMTV
jgi:hypothetical protein